MKMNEFPKPSAATPPEVFQQLGLITRQLHEALNQLGVMPRLQQSAEGLSDARSRLGYIVRKTGEAAEKVLNSVDQAKAEREKIAVATGILMRAGLDAPSASASAAVMNAAADVDTAASLMDKHLTDIMLAQDFHDLVGQVVGKVVAVAIELEDSLVKLLLQTASAELASQPEDKFLNGPVVESKGRTDVVTGQGEVDDLLASLGF